METQELNEVLIQLKNQLPDEVGKLVVEKGLKMEDVEKAFSEKLISIEDFENVKKGLEAISDTVKNLKVIETKKESLFDSYKKKHIDVLKLVDTRANGFVKIADVPRVTKAAATMLESSNITGVYPPTAYEPGVNGMPNNIFILRQFANVGDTNSNTISYAEQKNRDGSVSKQTEGNAKSLNDFDIVVATATVETYAGLIKISRQMLNDVPFMFSEISSELMYKLGLAEETALYTYLATVAQTLDNAALADKFALNKSNYFDAILAAMTQIRMNMKGNAKVNLIAMNPADIYSLQTTKDSDNGYVVPTWASPTGFAVNGVPVIAFDGITAGTFMVADLSKLHIRDLEGVTIQQGFSGEDFEKNLSTIRAESRFAAFVKSNDVEGIIIDTFANAKAFLEAAA